MPEIRSKGRQCRLGPHAGQPAPARASPGGEWAWHAGPAFLASVLGIVLPVCSAAAGDFIAGADFSHLVFFESRGVVYRDAGQTEDGLAILKRRGLTCVRLRLFTSSAAQAQADPYNYANNLDYTLPLALRVKNAGLQFMLDLHYSDSWADPGQQTKPAAWTNLTFTQLATQMRQYNSNCIAAFKAEGATPDYVQVGNEIIGVLLWPDGQVGGAYDTPSQWSKRGFRPVGSAATTERQPGRGRSHAGMALERGWFGTGDSYASDPADSLAAGNQCRAEHGDDIQPHLAVRPRPRPLLSFAVELTNEKPRRCGAFGENCQPILLPPAQPEEPDQPGA